MADSKRSKKIVRGREREEQALQLRIAGLTYRCIGEEMGISESGAYKAVARALRRLNERIAESAEELRRIEMERLNALHLAFWPRAEKGDEKAADRILRIGAAIRALWGLDAARTQQNLNLDLSQLTNEQLERIAKGENPIHVLVTSRTG